MPEDEKLPAIDVFICTADPNKEPAEGVMNTVISAMALEYPPDKINVYVSDDGGSSVTLNAMKETWGFAKLWLPFCRKYGVVTRSPQAYFCEGHDDESLVSAEFVAEKEKVQQEYEAYTERVRRIRENESSAVVNNDHPPVVEVIGDKYFNTANTEQEEMPLLVYVSREKRPSHSHHFKAGALNTLLRVSGLISNSPYVLGLDCDMYCNDPNSARQAMCFHLDPELSPSLAFVQFPQCFSNISKYDIYESELRSTFKTLWHGMDGIKGPVLSGTCYYLKREAVYGISVQEEINLMELRQSFGSSNEFIRSLHEKYKPNVTNKKDLTNALLKDSHHLASCVYENNTKWGKEVGFRYLSVVEDYFTSFNLHCNGWVSVYFNPPRPAFLGTGVTSLNDLLVQGTRWSAGLVEVGLSSFSPFIYGSLRMSILQSMCYGWLAFFPFYFLSLWILATVPQLCLLNGIPLFPEVTNSFFSVFLFIFVSSHFQHIRDILSTSGPIRAWKDEQRVWMIKSVTSHLYGSLHAIMEKIGTSESSFLPTNKVVDVEHVKFYQMGKFDFQASPLLLVPLCSLVILNFGALIGGVAKVISTHSFSEMFIQLFIPFFVVTMNYPIIEGMIVRNDKGRIPPFVTLGSAAVSLTILLLGSLVLMY